jgi:hypothetical protein
LPPGFFLPDFSLCAFGFRLNLDLGSTHPANEGQSRLRIVLRITYMFRGRAMKIGPSKEISTKTDPRDQAAVLKTRTWASSRDYLRWSVLSISCGPASQILPAAQSERRHPDRPACCGAIVSQSRISPGSRARIKLQQKRLGTPREEQR